MYYYQHSKRHIFTEKDWNGQNERRTEIEKSEKIENEGNKNEEEGKMKIEDLRSKERKEKKVHK